MQTATGIIIYSFPHIRPINTAEEGVRRGYYTDYLRFIANKTVPLQPAQGEKTLHLVYHGQIIRETGYIKLLRVQDKQPCRNAPNYLLGLMAQVPEEQMPAELRDKDIVAAEPNNAASDFALESGFRSFLCVYRNGTRRVLNLTRCGRGVEWHCAFLAEDLMPETLCS